MSRPLRLEHPGALWHVTSRGNERREIFRDDPDRELFLETLGRVVAMFRWRLYAWVLMNNHYHLLLETPEPNLSRGMRQLNGIYTQRFNRRHGRSGHLMQGRFKGILVEKEAHLLELCRYVVLNPVRAGAARSARNWRWSSYRATAGNAPSPGWLEMDGVLSLFGGRPAAARERYRRFVSDGIRTGYAPWQTLTHQVLLGGEEFVEETRRLADGRALGREIPRAQRDLRRPTLEAITRKAARVFHVGERDIRKKRGGPVRLAVALAARRQAALPLDQIGAFLGVRSWSASHMATAAEQLAEKDAAFRTSLEALLAEIP
jgi:REP element-mobilizing transposase RayT